jgi:UDPglucose 6-dehydrogenase|tara:strand:- start:2055 stop:2813 length:759 start_codon:yes stop_codon:yes gene_type:complete
MKITIAGYGFVGKAHHALLKDDYKDIQIVDPKFNNELVSYNTEAVIICVATPANSDDTCNMQHVFEVMDAVPVAAYVLIKSTISLEGWKELVNRYPKHEITFSPEYLRAESAVEDLKKSQTIDISTSGKYYFWHMIFEGVIPNFSSRLGTPEELILAKYFRNSFLATKVAFFNQVYDLCETTGINYETVAQHIGNDPRIGHSHTSVTLDRGFGGHCFPKDTAAILKSAENDDVDLSILREAVYYNKRIRNQV